MRGWAWLVAVALGVLLAGQGSVWAAADVHKTSAKAIAAPVIAIVDVQRILEESLAAKSVQQQLETQRAKFQTEISGEESGLRQAEKDLAQLRDTASPDVYAEKEQGLRQRFLGVERRVQSRRKALDQAFTDSMNVVRGKLLDTVSSLAKERGANMVIVKQQALWSEPGMDITDEVLSLLNKDLPKVPVKVIAEEEEPAATKDNYKMDTGLLKKKTH